MGKGKRWGLGKMWGSNLDGEVKGGELGVSRGKRLESCKRWV